MLTTFDHTPEVLAEVNVRAAAHEISSGRSANADAEHCCDGDAGAHAGQRVR